MNNTIICYIGLGSNLNNPTQQIKTALLEITKIPETKLTKSSSLYSSKPLAPYSEQPSYVNAVAELETTLSAKQLLESLHDIEVIHGRDRKTRWEPRVLDLDLLLYGEHSINEPTIRVPHPEMYKRDFVLYPLYEIAPHITLPGGASLAYLLANCLDNGLQKL
ncbi:MAG: 2-amino-4-hydroxy-6-hydroxymethyldihydropteridine diphosphokinase [Proteobacteria bacterium]|nr:2-amino-4-hydroxy-6-hydroxymethyldihydropteridine diphosphokinase [Pseudomonadota bacterium]